MRHYKIRTLLAAGLIMLTMVHLSGSQTQVNAASKDKTKPTVTTKVSTTQKTNKDINVEVKVSDKSGITQVKYLSGDKKTADFKSKGTKVTIKSQKGNFKVKKNGTYTIYVSDKANNITLKKVKISNIDKTAPELVLSKDISYGQKASIKTKASDHSGVSSIKWYPGSLSDVNSSKWSNAYTAKSSFQVKNNGTYSVLATDAAGNKTIKKVNVDLEFKAMWISYLEFDQYRASNKSNTFANFKLYIDKMFDKCKDLGMNAVMVQVRPFGDALYESDYFPWSANISGKQGKDPGYDPMEYMISAAHSRDLEFHAWLNPYRVSASSSYTSLFDDNQAKKWHNSTNSKTKRNVLNYDGKLYYNPSVSSVRTLITNGVKEIVENYDVDGIHMDDYFYPSFSASNVSSAFDSKEYMDYKTQQLENGSSYTSIAVWRRNNVSTLVKRIQTTIKDIDPNIVFGISPAGNLSNLRSNYQHYTDIDKWLGSTSYIDYICPQIYWGFEHSTAAYDKMVDQWITANKAGKVQMYIGLAVYKAGSPESTEWKNDTDILADQIEYARDTNNITGLGFYRYDFFGKSATQKAINKMLPLLK